MHSNIVEHDLPNAITGLVNNGMAWYHGHSDFLRDKSLEKSYVGAQFIARSR